MTRSNGSSPGIQNPAGSPLDPAAPALLTIDLGALCDNYRYLAALAPGAECAAVVKADAYGIGVKRAVPALIDAGCRTFFVATLGEARNLRGVAGDVDLYVLDGLFPDAAPEFAAIDARPVLGSLPEIEDWSRYCADTGEKRPAALHIDTGMNRLGMRPGDVDALADDPRLIGDFTPALVISHLACGDDPDEPMNVRQRTSFDELRSKLPPCPSCFANSAGIFLGPAYHYDMVRPGVALYGARAVNGVANPMKPVVRLDIRIVQIRDAEPGETVGYGANRKLATKTRIATAAAGYADGIFRHLGAADGESGMTAYIGEYAAPILGRVSMDTITLAVSHIPPHLAARGAFVEVIGPHISVDDLAEKAGTIGYEVLTSLGHRYERRYVGLEKQV